jgi:3-hydroxy-9,10-secoandrosta-1,3,5(10)-triene-9,17-dione monooxygenase reductase component
MPCGPTDGWRALTGSPVLDGVLAWVDCQIQAIHPGCDHKIAVCRVLGLGREQTGGR